MLSLILPCLLEDCLGVYCLSDCGKNDIEDKYWVVLISLSLIFKKKFINNCVHSDMHHNIELSLTATKCLPDTTLLLLKYYLLYTNNLLDVLKFNGNIYTYKYKTTVCVWPNKYYRTTKLKNSETDPTLKYKTSSSVAYFLS